VIDDEVQIRRLPSASPWRRRLPGARGRLGPSRHQRGDVPAADASFRLGLPDLAGLEVLTRLREWSHVAGSDPFRPGQDDIKIGRAGRRRGPLPHQAVSGANAGPHPLMLRRGQPSDDLKVLKFGTSKSISFGAIVLRARQEVG